MHCDIVETGDDGWRFESRDDDRTTRARAVSATPTSSDDASATSEPRRSEGSLFDADVPFQCRLTLIARSSICTAKKANPVAASAR